MSAAARQLQVAQPTVGRRISAFENSLGAKLFVGTASGQALSEIGRNLLRHAEQMEQGALAAARVATGKNAGLSGCVRITATEWLIRSVLGPLLAPFISDHPDLELELLADPRHLNLARGDADIAIRASRFEQNDVVQRAVGRIAFGLYASDAYLSRHGPPDFRRQCEGHALLCMSTSLLKIPDVEWLPTIAARARVVVRTNGREAMVTMATAGMGLVCLPCFLGDATPGLRLLSGAGPGPVRQLWIGVHRHARATPRVRATVGHLTQCIQRLQPALCPRAE
jgi:DNA-binding transcriptional LysR family regulator